MLADDDEPATGRGVIGRLVGGLDRVGGGRRRIGVIGRGIAGGRLGFVGLPRLLIGAGLVGRRGHGR